MKAIAFAMLKEAEPLLLKSRTEKMMKVGVGQIQLCKLGDIPYLLVITGIGKVNAASAITALAVLHGDEVDSLVVAGVSGSLDSKKAPLFSSVISSSCVQHDVDTSPIGDPVGFVSTVGKTFFEGDPNVIGKLEESAKRTNNQSVVGVVASGDQFVADSTQKQRITSLFSPLAVDMESASVAQIAYSYDIPFCALRTISDADDHGNEYVNNTPKASAILTDILIDYLSNE